MQNLLPDCNSCLSLVWSLMMYLFLQTVHNTIGVITNSPNNMIDYGLFFVGQKMVLFASDNVFM